MALIYLIFGTVFGLVQLITSMLGALGPMALGILADQLDGYDPAIQTFVLIPVGAALLLGLLRPPAGASPGSTS